MLFKRSDADLIRSAKKGDGFAFAELKGGPNAGDICQC
jgi:hypothetical protein